MEYNKAHVPNKLPVSRKTKLGIQKSEIETGAKVQTCCVLATLDCL